MNLWKAKKCQFNYTIEDFELWCDHVMTDDVVSFGIKDQGEIVGGCIVYPILLPPSLSVQLMITLRPEDRKLFRPVLNRLAKNLGFNIISCACPVDIAEGMRKLFDMKEIARVYRWETE